MVDLKTFGANIYLLIGLVVCLAVLLVLILAAWTLLKTAVWQSRRKKAAEQERRQRLRPDGQAYPPAAPGICQRCQRAGDAVYHLPSGERFCADCYARQIATGRTPQE